MKKVFIVMIGLALLISSVFISSCGKSETAGSEKMILGEISDLSEFTIIRSESGSDGGKEAAVELRKLLKEKFSAELSISTDFNGDKGKEILVGYTSRSASKKTEVDINTYSEFVIKRTGDKIVIMGGSDEALMSAINFWTTNMVNRAGKLCIPNDEQGYISSPDVKFKKLTVEGIDINEFAIYNTSSVFSKTANKIKELLVDYADAHLSIVDNKNLSKNLIIMDVSTDDTKKSSIEVKDGHIYVNISCFDTDWAVEYLKSVFDGASESSFDITSDIDDSSAEYEVKTFYNKDDLMAVLEKAYNSDGIIVGTEMVNGGNAVENTLDNYYEKSGEYPGIIGLDVRLSNLTKLGEVGRAKVIADLTKYAEQGGIITASAHFSNPAENGGDPTVENYRGRFGGDDAWDALITEGTDYNTSFKKELEGIADFFEALKDNGVPVIWRPLHETNGNWFWFCMVQGMTKVSEESFANLWIYIHDYFTNERGLDNLLWEFGPNIGKESDTMTAPLYGFPGKEYVDLVGFDWYTGDGDASKIETTPTYKDLASLDMIININEFGPGGDMVADDEDEVQSEIFSCRNILGFFEEFKHGGYKLGYFLTWTSHISIPELGYADEFMASEITLGLTDVKALFDSLE